MGHDDLKWMLDCPKSGEPCYCKNECVYLRNVDESTEGGESDGD